jgi:hypothetical protein
MVLQQPGLEYQVPYLYRVYATSPQAGTMLSRTRKAAASRDLVFMMNPRLLVAKDNRVNYQDFKCANNMPSRGF